MRETDHVHGVVEDWPFESPPNSASFVSKVILEEPSALIGISHDEDGEWQFLDGGPNDVDHCAIVCLYCMWTNFPEIGDHADLAPGRQIWKKDSGEWQLRKPSLLERLRVKYS